LTPVVLCAMFSTC